MITSMRRCVAYNDLWPWPISSRSFGLDLENRVLSVASTVLDGFFPYVVQMITSMRRCVACDDLWPWPISSRSFGLDLKNRVLSVASTVLDGFFPYLVQMISSMRRCVACDDLWPWPISSRSFDLDFENRVRSVTFSVLDRLFFWLGIQYDSIMWVIMRRRGVSSERRRSSYASLTLTLDFQGQILKILYLRNGRADWHGTKGMWIDRMLDPRARINSFLSIQFQFKIIQFNSNSIHAELNWIDYQFQFNSWIDPSPVRPTLWLWTVTPPMTLTLDFQGQILKKVVTQDWDGRLTWNERDVSR